MNAEVEPVFIDTNILIYAHDRSAGFKYEVAKNLIDELWQSEQGCLSLQVLQEFFVNVTQKLSKPIERKTAREIISNLAEWRIHLPQFDDLLQAINLQEVHSLSFWDAMVINSAIQLGCSVLISEDLAHDQVYTGVRVINPFLENGDKFGKEN